MKAQNIATLVVIVAAFVTSRLTGGRAATPANPRNGRDPAAGFVPATLGAALLLFFGSCAVAQTGVAVDRPNGSLDPFMWGGLSLLAFGVFVCFSAYRAVGAARVMLLLMPSALVLVPCGAFYLSDHGLGPFQVSDATGAKYALRRAAPAQVQYSDGYTVGVGAPRVASSAASANVWVVPITISDRDGNGPAHVGLCSGIYLDGTYGSAYRERPAVRALGDIGGTATDLSPGTQFEGRLAFEIPSSIRTVVLQCWRKAYVPAYFDLSAWVVAR